MEVKTQSGTITVNKRSPYGKFLRAYIDAGAWTGHATVAAAWLMCRQIWVRYDSVSWADAARITAACFMHKPSDAYLEQLTGVAMER